MIELNPKPFSFLQGSPNNQITSINITKDPKICLIYNLKEIGCPITTVNFLYDGLCIDHMRDYETDNNIFKADLSIGALDLYYFNRFAFRVSTLYNKDGLIEYIELDTEDQGKVWAEVGNVFDKDDLAEEFYLLMLNHRDLEPLFLNEMNNKYRDFDVKSLLSVI